MSARWLQSLLRPRITSVQVLIFEDGKEKDISTYDEYRLHAIMENINTLWKVPDQSPFWFETEIHEQRTCWKKIPSTLHVTCYKEDMTKSSMRTRTGIPNKYRLKFFDKVFAIKPESAVRLTWPSRMEIKFKLVA